LALHAWSTALTRRITCTAQGITVSTHSLRTGLQHSVCPWSDVTATTCTYDRAGSLPKATFAVETSQGAAVAIGLIAVHQALLWACPTPGGARNCPGVRDPAPTPAVRAGRGVLVPKQVVGPAHGHLAVPVAVVACAPPRALSSPLRGHLRAFPAPSPDRGGAQCPYPRTAAPRQPQGDTRQTERGSR
jgi:hypothetical protein